jgi:hypothetical protein
MSSPTTVTIARRFRKSIRIDTDLTQADALDGYVCTPSVAEVLKTMARHVAKGQGAFTWTGPYGSGKSSLVVALSALLSSPRGQHNKARKVFGKDLTKTLCAKLPRGTKGWRVIPVVGQRATPVKVIGEAVKNAIVGTRQPRGGWTVDNLKTTLMKEANAKPKSHGGLLVFIDEMGKFLEAAAQDGSDLFVLQELAEAANRSKGRLIVIGVLHQAFQEYAHRATHDMREEWAKIQGRFIDQVVDTVGEEQIELISQAITSKHAADPPSPLAVTVAEMVRGVRTVKQKWLAAKLEGCWPLHPVVVSLLGPISRRGFGQSQRSIFGFLNSPELAGLQDFLDRRVEDTELYTPDRLWEYLRGNLESSILASPDGHRWAGAADAIARCELQVEGELHLTLLKTIAVIDLFKDRSGLVASEEILQTCVPNELRPGVQETLRDLQRFKFTLFKQYSGGYAIYEGSDFDIEDALRKARKDLGELNFSQLHALAGIQPILAKRHFHDTGTMRWFDVKLTPVRSLTEEVTHSDAKHGAIGQFLLVIPTEEYSQEEMEERCHTAAAHCSESATTPWDTVVGLSEKSRNIFPLARDLFALETVRDTFEELAGDPIARIEVNARFTEVQSRLEQEFQTAFDHAFWFHKNENPQRYRQVDLHRLASTLADERFHKCPLLRNELLNRQKPSGSAKQAQKKLLHHMVKNVGDARLGIPEKENEKPCYPAERGLFESLLKSTGLYENIGDEWRFVDLASQGEDPCGLKPMWKAALDFIKKHENRTVKIPELFELWQKPPYGVKAGLMPILIVAFIQAHQGTLAVYKEGTFRAVFNDVDVDDLAKDAASIQVRWMDLDVRHQQLLEGMLGIVSELDPDNKLHHPTPIDVAKKLVAIYLGLPQWTHRTMDLTENAKRMREHFKVARDPNKFLFEDLGKLDDTPETISNVHEGLKELKNHQPEHLGKLRDVMLKELQGLQVPNYSPQAMSALHDRAKNIQDVSGDTLLESFLLRLVKFDGHAENFASIASLAAHNKPLRDWRDPDFDKAGIALAELAQKFIRTEKYAHVVDHTRQNKRQSMAVVIGIADRREPVQEEFSVTDADRAAVDDLIERVTATLDDAEPSERNVILAALAELFAQYIKASPSPTTDTKGRVAS